MTSVRLSVPVRTSLDGEHLTRPALEFVERIRRLVRYLRCDPRRRFATRPRVPRRRLTCRKPCINRHTVDVANYATGTNRLNAERRGGNSRRKFAASCMIDSSVLHLIYSRTR